MSEFTKGKWIMDTKIKRVSCAVWRTIRKADSNIESNDNIAYIPQVRCNISEEEALANARLIAAAPEMYRLLCEFLKIDEQKAWAATEKNDTAYMMALVAQDGAVNMAKELLARIDGTEEKS